MTTKALDHRYVEINVAKKEISLGFWIIAIFFGSLFGWATFVALPTAAIAPGVVGIEGYRKTIQHLEGGLVHKILVKDGDTVKAGETLVVLDNLRTQSDYELLRKQRITTAAREARLKAEYDRSDDIRFPDWLTGKRSDSFVRKAISNELDTFHVHRDLYDQQSGILQERITQSKLKISGLEQQITALNKQRRLIAKELTEYRDYAKRGLVTRSQVFSLERQNVQIEADLAETRVSISSTNQDISALQLRLSELAESQTKDVLTELSSARGKLLKIEKEFAKTNDQLSRTNIVAPIDGIVVGLKIHTTGGVIKSGQSIMDLVPSQENLVIEARVDPKDRDTVRVGQKAEVRFTAFNQRATPPVPGKVVHISADRFVDKSSRSGFYNARIELTASPEDILNGESIFPGMQAEVLILTGTRTALSYLIDPISQSFNRSFRED